MWKQSLLSINKYLADERPNGLWYGQADMNTGTRTTTYYGALDAFFPAVLALSGDVDRAAKLQDSSYAMWNLAGVEPDQLNYVTMTITNPEYPLRPEIIESTYYLYTYTHDPKYLAMGKTYLDSLMKYCRTDDGFAALADVRSKKKDGCDGELLFCRDVEVSLFTFCAAIYAEFSVSNFQHGSASDAAQLYRRRRHFEKRKIGPISRNSGQTPGFGAGLTLVLTRASSGDARLGPVACPAPGPGHLPGVARRSGADPAPSASARYSRRIGRCNSGTGG